MHAVARDWRSAPLAPANAVLCAFAVKLTREPHAVLATDLDALRAHGFDDRALHDAVQVVGYFNYVTRVADGLGVEPEPGLPHWGAPGPRGAA